MTIHRTFEASAPGRMDVMGGIADYSGSLVLQMPIRQKTTVRMSLRDDYICTLSSDVTGEVLRTTILLKDVLEAGEVLYSKANAFFRAHPNDLWTGYVIGCGLVLQKEKGIKFKGADFEIYSDVPLGKGVSSSAALEVATMKVFGQAFNIDFQSTELPVLAQRVENLIVGAACGLMDQLASYFGLEGKLLPILCQPDILFPPVNIPPDLKIVGIDSGVRHSVLGASYSEVRCAAFMGYSMIATHLGVPVSELVQSRESGIRDQLPFAGYLSNITTAVFEKLFSHVLPKTLRGDEFMERYGSTIDPVTSVDKNTVYKIFECTAHPVYENERVREFNGLISSRTNLERLGELMYQSHESYSRCGLGSDRTDELVSMARSAAHDGVLGAKITGGGSGGTVCLLVRGSEGMNAARKIHATMSERYGRTLMFFD